MFKLIGHAAKTLISFVALIVVAWAGWRWGDRLFPPLERMLGLETPPAAEAPPTPSAELADETVRRWEDFVGDKGRGEMLVSDLEATSVLRHGPPELLPPGITDPRVEFQEGGMKVSGKVVRAAFPELPELGGVLGMLPDTLPMEMDAVLIPFEGDETALVVRRISALGLPLPRRVVPQVLDALGRRTRPGLPPEAVLVPLPEAVLRAYVLDDSLHLVGRH